MPTSPVPTSAGGYRAPSPYGAAHSAAEPRASRPPAPTSSGRRRGRRRGGPDGDLEIRPALDTIGYGLIVCLVFGFGVFAQTASVIAAAFLTGAALLVWIGQSVYVLVSRVRVVSDVLEVRVLGQRKVVLLSDLDAPVRAKVGGRSSLRLRLTGGRHLAALPTTLWGEAAITLLADRLGGVRSTTSSAAQLEQEFPGALGRAGRHQVVLAIAAVVALFALVGAAVYLGAR